MQDSMLSGLYALGGRAARAAMRNCIIIVVKQGYDCCDSGGWRCCKKIYWNLWDLVKSHAELANEWADAASMEDHFEAVESRRRKERCRRNRDGNALDQSDYLKPNYQIPQYSQFGIKF